MQAWNKNGKLMTECRTQGKKPSANLSNNATVQRIGKRRYQ
jgi:hypothetical protein